MQKSTTIQAGEGAEPGKPMSLLAYSKRRGMSHEAVRKAIAAGRLSRSLVMVNGKPKIADPELADLEWEANTHPALAAHAPAASASAQPADGDTDFIDFNEARRRHEIEKWRQAKVQREVDELELSKRKAELVPVAEVRAEVESLFTEARTKLLAVPSKIKQRLPHLTTADVQQIDGLIREAMEALADGR